LRRAARLADHRRIGTITLQNRHIARATRHASAPTVSGMSRPDHRGPLGRRGEDLAVAHLERLGFAVVARNHRTRYGEIDVIACDGRALVFAEVKTRRGGDRSPLESVGEEKQEQVRRMARAWLAETRERPRRGELRFDAIGITLDAAGGLLALEHVEGAF
jgi:putative endonuclease